MASPSVHAPIPVALPAPVPPVRHGGWREGDPPGQRRFCRLFEHQPLALESGESLGPITLAYETWGTPRPDGSRAVLLLHGFSGDSHAAGPPGSGHAHAGWWDGLIGPGRAIDTDRLFVVCPNVLGGCQGSTGPSSLAADGRPYGSRFPALTIRDQVAAEVALADRLGIGRWHAVIGGSMGGMRALEWAVGHPARLERLVALATTARCSAENIAFHRCQIQAIRMDPRFHGGDYDGDPGGGPREGLALARSIARLTYGHADASPCPDLIEGSQNDHVDANSFIVLTRAMGHHDVGRGRGGIRQALGRIQARVRVVSIATDRLFPPQRQLELAQAITSGVTMTTLESPQGHDGFLKEHRQLDPILRQSLG